MECCICRQGQHIRSQRNDTYHVHSKVYSFQTATRRRTMYSYYSNSRHRITDMYDNNVSEKGRSKVKLTTCEYISTSE